MPSPEARDEHVVDALLDAGALLEDPMRMAAVLDELRTRRAEPDAALRAAVAERLAAAQPRPRRARPSRRLVFATGALAICAAVAVVGAVALTGGGTSRPQAVTDEQAAATLSGTLAGTEGAVGAAPKASYRAATSPSAAVPAHVVALPTSSRLQDYQASMQLRVAGTKRLSQVTQRAISLTRGFGGYVTSSNVDLQSARSGSATVDVRVPIARVQDAILRFSSLGVIVGQHVAVTDLQASYDKASARIESLRHSLALIEIRLADPKVTPLQRLALLTQRERARHALAGATETTTSLAQRGAYARLDLSFATGEKVAPVVPRRPGRLEHAVRRAGGMLETISIGALFVLILALPVALVIGLVLVGWRGMRRRGERALLERA